MSPAYIKYLSLTPHVESLESVQCIHVGDQKGLYVYLRAEQSLVYFGADIERTARL